MEYSTDGWEAIVDYWEEKSGWELDYDDKLKIRSAVRRFGADEVVKAMDIAEEQYMGNSRGYAYRQQSFAALNKVGGICYNREKLKEGE